MGYKATETLRDTQCLWYLRHVVSSSGGVQQASLVGVGIVLSLLQRRLTQGHGPVSVKVHDSAAASIPAVRDTDVMVGQLQRDLSQGHHDELRPLTAFSTHLRNSFSVVSVQVLVNFIEVVERAWVVILDGKNERKRCHRLLTSGKLLPIDLRGLAPWLGPKFKPTFERIFGVFKEEFTATAVREFFVSGFEILIHLFQHRKQPRLALLFEL